MAGSFNRGAFEATAFDVEDLAALVVAQTLAVPTQTVEASVEVAVAADATVTATNTTVAGPIVAAEAAQTVSVVVQVGDLDNPIYGSATQSIAVPTLAAETSALVTINALGAFSASAFQADTFLVAPAGSEIAVPTQVAEAVVGAVVDTSQTIPVPGQTATVANIVLAEAATEIAIPTQVAEVSALPGFLSSNAIAVPSQSAAATVEVSAASNITATLTETETGTVLVQAQSAITIAAPVNTARFIQLKLRPDFTARAPSRPLFVAEVERPLFHVKDTRRPFEARLPV